MASRFLITGTEPGVGKTMVGCALAFAFKVRALRVGVMKPIETGCTEQAGTLVAEDAAALVAAASSELLPALVCQFRYRSDLAPIAAAETDGLAPPEFDRIEKAAREVIAASDVVLIEDCGGLAAQLDFRRNFADLARSLELEVILVTANRGRFLNNAALTLDYAARRSIPVRGFILNSLDREASATVSRDAEMLARVTGTNCLGTVRFKEPLALSIIEKLL